ncbi:HAD family phosphatase [Marinimicrobium sp. ABcell2]|uniref:HAD family hydrolase n=1 Tax=Marinimicrobium sp. ABcell2 TaxID=3069751 RepID=UPI0027B77A1C|nr:HAD-IB family hydrolase [Marinimicrobium sp. ABcell2]MDQ2077925.1 HAD-IB family hydrolase [Marinimicrobium sp. ABcell2]
MTVIQKAEVTHRSYVFFDVDDTLISVKSMLSFQDYWYQVTGDSEAEARYRADLREHMHEQACWNALNRLYYQHFAGRAELEVTRRGKEWFVWAQEQHPSFYHIPVVEELRAHQKAGREVVFVSGSFPALLKPIAEELGVRHILCTRLEVRDGRYTGEILAPQTIGDGKVEAIQQFLSGQGVSAETCYAYGDDLSDLPMLKAVGNATVVGGGRGLESHARELGWRVVMPA